MITAHSPEISIFSTDRNFRYLWLKYVTGFDLSVHCAKCLVGEYSKRRFTDGSLLLDEFPAEYYYLCGVVMPYKWADNLHLAFRYKEGGRIEYNDGHTRIDISNAEAIPIRTLPSYSLHPKGKFVTYNTCRNWRFAYQTVFGL